MNSTNFGGSIEGVKTVPQEQVSERICAQWVTAVRRISSQHESCSVQREQIIDMSVVQQQTAENIVELPLPQL